ncbi:heat-inducible transcriptional repressor HrcA [Gemella haemolysans]|uniref:Heat-inducible transcription repressor HrcA n=2 Tax=Gemella haemolysans TaxID=1379 RepID=C5NUW6_9BACL|nr:heat-inducible transcriptional repressor HrcA [Gemella haemolysans]EER69032.1 heat-inducible transcription repressor HrcA [Gemella haemolysans ATCC 10379]KAA8708025.1 heat-inducible transcription repressor HrcA [Gemella haemolysans]MBS5318751.1 heat-inducible transcription repressor HrcA [Gemella haemolysans]MDU8069803.1 heat-inducible transcriptional repressor HrcA [Gemella haemolysans]UBH82000.1 heat-inducible transcriptional repressor HrcA [Gemella haemolysans]
MTMLIDRQVLILQSIVENFITTNQPVGSKQIAQNIDFSSATIRNDMSKLEKEGLIKKTHISSGRVPSEKGYRYYVDYIKKDYELSNSENEKLKQLSGGDIVSENNYLEKNAIVLSDLTDCTAVILAPTKTDRRINKIEVILLSSRSILVILVTNIGEVFQQNYKLDADFTAEDIAEINKLLQSYFYDVDMATAHVMIHGELEKYLKNKVNNYDMIVVALNRLLQNKIKKTVALGGKYNLLKQPDIDNVEKLKEVVSLLEDDKIVELLDNNEVTDKPSIKIGTELKLGNIDDLSLVSSSYNTSKGQGVIAVFGPKRMDYSKIMTLIACVRDNLNNNLK